MRVMRRLLLLAIIGVAGVAAYNYYWSENGSRVRATVARSDVEAAKRRATQLANQTAGKARTAANSLNDTISDGALTAKIKSKMALDDRVKANSIQVDTSGSVVTLTGTVASADERQRAVRLARETDGITRVIDRLHVTQ